MLFASFEVDKKVQLVILKHYFSKIMFYETDKQENCEIRQ